MTTSNQSKLSSMGGFGMDLRQKESSMMNHPLTMSFSSNTSAAGEVEARQLFNFIK